jgi:hypothetical protein
MISPMTQSVASTPVSHGPSEVAAAGEDARFGARFGTRFGVRFVARAGAENRRACAIAI